MRAVKWFAVLVLGVGLADTARAQSAPTWGTDVGPLQYKIVTANQKSAISAPQIVPQNSSPQRFFSRNTGRINNKSVIGRSVFPTYEQLPGQDYLSGFEIQRHPRLANPWYSWIWPF